uniref:Uncharacterized protein n=1 Tax=Myotis myotis TaxID=51298 RepID=A0A7J7QW89_MYOMY|nr:hypothetical protein mMyoMyo1_011286 [Myotis myotis]
MLPVLMGNGGVPTALATKNELAVLAEGSRHTPETHRPPPREILERVPEDGGGSSWNALIIVQLPVSSRREDTCVRRRGTRETPARAQGRKRLCARRRGGSEMWQEPRLVWLCWVGVVSRTRRLPF